MTSRKLIISLLASMVMRNPLLLKIRHISFFFFFFFIFYYFFIIYLINYATFTLTFTYDN